MKYWKEKESNPVETMEFWKGEYITKLEPNEIFVMGTNPSGIHGAGAAKAGLKFGAKILQGRGLVGSTYGLITKNLEGKEGFVEKATGIVYHKAGFRSVSPEQIRDNIDEMYAVARQPEHKDKKFLITYQYNTWANGSPKKSLNGYDSQEILELFAKDKDVPPNIVFHESYKPHLEKLYKNQNKQSNGELVVYEDDKIFDIKEEDIVWTIDEDERNPEGRHGAGAAKAAMGFKNGAMYGVGRGLVGRTFAVITKNLTANYLEKKTGILYKTEGYLSVSESQIRENIKDLYDTARTMPEKAFLISYQLETWPNGSPKKSLNGYTSKEILDMFIKDQDIPDNIVFHDSYQKELEKVLGSSVNVKSVIHATNTPTEIAFTKVSLPFGWMGNMAPYPVTYEGQEYKTTEALFQALRFEGFPDIQQKIIAEKSPMSAKLVAKEHKQVLIDNGYEVMGKKDVENMRLCVKLKLEQHPDLAQQLIDTGNAVIIENCTSRPEGSGVFWGSAKKDNQWVGKNVLGEVLMDFRDKLQHNKELQVNIEQQQPVLEEVKPKEYTFFFHLTSPFSNFHPSKFEYKELTFVSNEQFMMYSKAKTFKDEVTAQKIIDMNNQPLIKDFIEGKYSREDIVKDKVLADQWNKLMMKTKGFGREVKNYDDAVWTNRRAKVVLFGARLKFIQNEDLKQILLATGDTYMVEASPYDKIWGIGLSAGDAKKTPESKWPGLNLLGKDLDIVKAEFKLELNSQVDTTVKKKFR